MDIKKEVIETIMRVIGREISNGVDVEKFADLGINSVSFIEMVVILEKKFGIRFNNADLDYRNFSSIDILCDYISKRIDML